MPRRPPSRPHLVALGVTLAGAALRFATLDLQSFGHDEAATAFYVLQPGFLETLTVVAEGRERTPPLYFALAWLWSQLFGAAEVGLRSLSALLGTLTILAAYLAARELASPRAGVVAAALVALNPFLIWYSQEARAYALLALFITLSILYLARAVRRGDRTDLALWALTAVAALSSHYFAAFLVVPEALLLLYRLRSRALAAVVATGAGGAVLLAFALYQTGDAAGVLSDASLIDRFARTVVSFSSTPQLDIYTDLAGARLLSAALSIAAGLGLLGGIALVVLRAREERGGGLLAARLGAFGLLVAVVLAYGGVDGVNPRSMIGVLPPLLIAAGIGFGARRSGWGGLAGAGGVCVLFLASLATILVTPDLQRRDFRAVAQAVGAAENRRLVVVPVEGVPPLIGYLPGKVRPARRASDEGRQRVREIVVVAPARRSGSPQRLRGAPRFELTGRERVANYRVSVYRSGRPRSVAAPKLERGPGRIALVAQEPGGRRGSAG